MQCDAEKRVRISAENLSCANLCGIQFKAELCAVLCGRNSTDTEPLANVIFDIFQSLWRMLHQNGAVIGVDVGFK